MSQLLQENRGVLTSVNGEILYSSLGAVSPSQRGTGLFLKVSSVVQNRNKRFLPAVL